MLDALEMWNDIELESGLHHPHEKLLIPGGILNFGDKNNRYFREILEQFPEDRIYTSREIMEIWPAFENLPENYIGLYTEDAGVVMAKKALRTVQDLAENKYGAELRYNVSVSEVCSDHVVLST